MTFYAFQNFSVNCSTAALQRVCPTHLFAVLTHHRADPGWAQLLPAQQTAGHSVPAHGLLHVIQAVDQAPAAAQGEAVL